ncbi:MAG: hypothetical protein K8S98_06470 [Planctomycetes bacterium]|nr:hypothetical protein [Planctomycetota bacterium]
MKKRRSRTKPATHDRRTAGSAPKMFLDPKDVDRAIEAGVREAVLRHKRLGQSIYALKDGRVVEIPASKIRVPRAR